MDFSAEELFEVIDRLVASLLEQAAVQSPPVDALYLAREHLGIPIVVQPAASISEHGAVRPFRRRPTDGRIILTADMTREQRQKAAAEGIATALAPEVCRKLGVPFEPRQWQFLSQLRTLFAPRLLVPTRMFRTAQRECQRDLMALHTVFSTASAEMIAMRWLDLDEPCVVTIVDDGVVAWRRSNCGVTGKRLLAVEQECHDRITALEQPQRLRREGWTVRGWPLFRPLVRRIVLHSVPDDL